MAAITLTVADEEGNAASLQVSTQDTVEALKALVEIEMCVPSAQQVLLKDGAPLAPGARLGALGVADNDFLFLVRDNSNANISGMSGRDTSTSSATTATATASADAGTGRANPASAVHSLKDLPAGLGPEQLMTTIKANGRLLAELQHHNAPLAAAIATGDVVKVRSVQMKQKLEAVSRRVEEQEAIRALEANPMDPEAQRKIESMIQRENVHRNMELAMEEMPEAFGSVVMLYVDVHVNGHPIKAFVDSGAQSTIMSAACALRCGLSRLIDTRFAGIAKGVGTSKILGRIHMHTLKVGEAHLPCTFTVLENDDVDFLFGLDMLKRHQCCIDLRRNLLVLGSAGKEVPFLAEKDLPARARGHQEEGAEKGGEGGREGEGSVGEGREAGLEGQLIGLGFSREQARSGLRRTEGNVEEAAALLLAEFGEREGGS